MLLSYKVGSEGLNLTEATHCIFIEPWWTNAVHNQAASRIYRSGQTKPVNIHQIKIKSTIEDHILAICHSKDEMAKMFLEDTHYSSAKRVTTTLDKTTLGKILGLYGPV
jgi:SNF2 family DNA or RNA helicase